MKKLTFILAALMLSLTLVTSCGVTNASSGYVHGTLTENGFESDWLGFEFVPTENLVMASEAEIEELMDMSADLLYTDEKTGKEIIDWAKVTTAYEMMATDITTQSNVIVMAEKLSLSNTTIEQYVEALKSQMGTQLDVSATYGELSEATVAGEKYTRFDYTISAYGIEVDQSMFLRKLDDRMVAICITATGEAEVEAFVACFKGK